MILCREHEARIRKPERKVCEEGMRVIVGRRCDLGSNAVIDFDICTQASESYSPPTNVWIDAHEATASLMRASVGVLRVGSCACGEGGGAGAPGKTAKHSHNNATCFKDFLRICSNKRNLKVSQLSSATAALSSSSSGTTESAA